MEIGTIPSTKEGELVVTRWNKVVAVGRRLLLLGLMVYRRVKDYVCDCLKRMKKFEVVLNLTYYYSIIC